MRSHNDLAARAVAVVLLLAAAAPWSRAAGAQTAVAPVAAGMPADVEVARALDAAAADPNLAAERTIKTLRWRSAAAPATPAGMPGWLRWIADLLQWIEQSARLLVWGAAAVAAGLLVVYIGGMIRKRTVSGVDGPFVAPTHVHDLDIRPESLPADIGAAARQLWDRGEQRQALALLYRGLLSRLAHVHRIPIRESSTEGDCLVLAAGRLASHQREDAARLVHLWQRFVYGHEQVAGSSVYELCDRFTPILDRAEPAAVTDPAARSGVA